MNYLKIVYAFILLLLLNWILNVMPFDGYLGKLVCLVLLVMIASNNSFLAIIGVGLILKNHGMSTENMTSQQSDTEKAASRANFRKKYCKKNKLMKDDKEISLKDLATAFPDLEMSGDKCNPCDNTCMFNIPMGAEKITDEERLRPKNSKESFVSR